MKNAFQNFLWVKGHLNLSTKKLWQKTVKGQFHVKKSGAKTSIFPQRKLLIGKSFIKHPFNTQRAAKLIIFNFKLLHRRLPTNCFLKKVGLRDNDKCSFCNKETENLILLFWRCEKTKDFWDSLFKWRQSCQLSLGEHNYLHINTALGLRPDRSKHKLQINFFTKLPSTISGFVAQKNIPPI